MAFGTVPNGTANRVWVGAAAGSATILVGGLQNWRYGGTSDTSKEEFYNGFTSIVTVGEPSRQGSGSGKWNDGDSGLAIVKAGFETQATISFAVAPNGTAGEGIPGRVSNFQLSGQGVRQAAGYEFTIEQADVPFNVGGGLV